jgi:hypothetical protein
VKDNLTLDYGVRVVHQVPQYDGYGKSSNFLPERWTASQAPVLFVAGCANGVYPCTGTNRQAMNPLSGQFLGPNSAAAIGTLVPNTGNLSNGVFADGQGIADTNYEYPKLAVAPRLGAAWDVSNKQTFVVRGSAGLFFDRPPAQNVYNTVNNPPFSRNVTVRYGQLQDLSSAGLTTEAPPTLVVWQYDEPLPASAQWNAGVQVALPHSTALDVAYTGQHSYGFPTAVNINAIDFGAAFSPDTQDRTQSSAVPGAASIASLNPDLARSFRGYGTIGQQQSIQWRTYHSLQVSLNRRLVKGLALGFADTIGLYDRQQAPIRLQHGGNGTASVRDDQEQANDLLGNNRPQTHIMAANFVWQLPALSGGGIKDVLRHVANDWSLSGIWRGATGASYVVTPQYTSNGASVNITGSPDYAPRIRIVGDTGSGCSSDPLRQLNAAAFAGPLPGSVGLDSGNDYARSCFLSQLDLAVARTIRLGRGSSNLQFRLDIFNLFNQAAVIARNATVQFASPTTPTTATNLPFDANGNVVDARARPRGAGFGVATDYQDPRTMQMQLRISF